MTQKCPQKGRNSGHWCFSHHEGVEKQKSKRVLLVHDARCFCLDFSQNKRVKEYSCFTARKRWGRQSTQNSNTTYCTTCLLQPPPSSAFYPANHSNKTPTLQHSQQQTNRHSQPLDCYEGISTILTITIAVIHYWSHARQWEVRYAGRTGWAEVRKKDDSYFTIFPWTHLSARMILEQGWWQVFEGGNRRASGIVRRLWRRRM